MRRLLIPLALCVAILVAALTAPERHAGKPARQQVVPARSLQAHR